MGVVACPRCGEHNSEWNPRCHKCQAALPMSSTGRSPSSAASAARPPTKAEVGPSLVGLVLGRYRLVELLGRGGTSEVYRADDAEEPSRQVAVKVLRRDRSRQQELRRRLKREAQAVGELDHPAIVKIYEVLETGNGAAIVMELVEGETLSNLLAGDAVDVPRLIGLTRQIAEGLAAAHERGIVHRDLKAENVMVTPEGRVKILDFGLVKRLETPDSKTSWTASLTVDGGVVGTFRAMSPEQARAMPVDHRSDLFSLGTLLYEALTGRSPFTGKGLAETLVHLCMHRHTPVSEIEPRVPVTLSRLIDWLLEKRPEDRPQSATEVVRQLGRIEV